MAKDSFEGFLSGGASGAEQVTFWRCPDVFAAGLDIGPTGFQNAGKLCCVVSALLGARGFVSSASLCMCVRAHMLR